MGARTLLSRPASLSRSIRRLVGMSGKVRLVVAALGLGLIWNPSAGLAQSLATAPAVEAFSIGAIQVSVLHAGRLAVPNDGSVFGTNASPEQVAEVLSGAGQPGDRIHLDIDVLLVRTDGHLTLIDAGYGAKGKSVLGQSLDLLHVSPLDITDVLLTHAHPDHAGGLVDEAGEPAFPRATIRMSENEWRFMQDQPATRDIAATVRAQVQAFTPGKWVLPGIRSKALYGHTPGHVLYELVSGDDRLLDIGDTAHSSVISLAKPAWMMGWDWNKSLGATERTAELEHLAASHELMFAVHFPFPGVGYITRKGNGFTFVPKVPIAREDGDASR